MRAGEGLAVSLSTVQRKLRRAARLTATDWVLLARAYVWIAVVRIALQTMSFARVRTLVEVGLPATADQPADGRSDRLATLVDIATRNHLGPVHCLPRALVLCRLLRSAGYPAELRIGVRRMDATLEAHAWVESNGRAVGERAHVAAAFDVLREGFPAQLLD